MESDATTHEERRGGEILAAISNHVVRLMREATGKGPTRCKTYWAGPDVLLVILGGGYLASEKTLYDAGRTEDVRVGRQAIQDVIEASLRTAVEELTGREVVAFMSAQHQDPDLQVEIFALEPVDDQPYARLPSPEAEPPSAG